MHVADRVAERTERRIELFVRRRLDEDTAVDLAGRLALRDADDDERRVCLECTHLQSDGGCYAARQGWLHATPRNFTPVRDLLQRCDRFDWADLPDVAECATQTEPD